jgi:hypothetical protein
MTSDFPKKMQRRIDIMMLDIITTLAAKSVRLTPALIEKMRMTVTQGAVEFSRLTREHELGMLKRARPAADPFRDEPTDPQMPSSRMAKS